MIFQNIELYETDKFQYLPIHKNGSSSVIKCIEDLDPSVTDQVNFNKIKWTVIREPYARFISGVKAEKIVPGISKCFGFGFLLVSIASARVC